MKDVLPRRRAESRCGSGRRPSPGGPLKGSPEVRYPQARAADAYSNMKEHPTILMKTKHMENGMLEHPTILMKTQGLSL